MGKRKSAIVLFLILTSIAILLFIPFRQGLVFEYQDTGRLLAYIPFSKEEKFQIKYTHSIHLTDVVESYQKTATDQIMQYELMYEEFSIGMPENASDGEIFEQKDGKYYLKNMNRVFPSFDLRVGQVRANHTVIYKNKEYPLSNYIEPGTWVRIKIERLNMLQLLKGVNILEST
ncbi:DUF1850 domain-containing protein [Bacillus sp. DTU_2020_1000418_1_SI_GHA_SEK_038]|uniref:DUF1850 domain-containing protein n=1 Tax=Bacillus sp. DTU_2020_1000418_1_SI_GHA_SEK_038 TaxID=3077585 RepID=UPI0028E80166|nr:DUF1850 domain-containing protein [Bacillus sp. DTU_2020_1000418_1_SI_GHA_SEK_038]WNS76902.1 DUF1850 domain-containing protein [Bacillus sp. DTU_2020_1000418_1_SI_GHA_SEK_038]